MTLYVGHWEAKYNGALHMKNFYRHLRDWVLENEYSKSRSDFDFPEKLYWESSASPTGMERWIWWRCVYVPEDNPFYRRILRINIHQLREKDVEIVKDNKKFKLQWAEHKIIVDAFIESDYEKRWQKHWLLKHFYRVFVLRFIWRDFKSHKQEVLQDVYSFLTHVKLYYDSYHWAQPTKSFRPRWGINEKYQYG
ncbi:MAG: hypothetical protein ABH879_07275 [archaeon]